MIELMKKAANNLLNTSPGAFENSIAQIIDESGGLLTRKAAAYALMDQIGLRCSDKVLSSDKNAVVFVFLVNRKLNKEAGD